MPVFSCANCGFRFPSDEQKNCPRCSSADVSEFKQVRSERGGVAVVREERQFPSAPGDAPARKPMVYREGKAGWQDFHTQTAVNECPKCGGKDFTLDYGKKEKVCKKCGEIYPLPRRFA